MRGLAMPALGIIPAHAGLTAYSISFAHCARDHSRVCGAHSGSGLYLTHFGGSSPRMRGSPEHGRLQSGHAGIIPAYAGLTHLQLVFCRCIWNHPRVCEAHESTSAGVTRSLGSSPRMRGSRSQTAAQRQRPGIIPAHAGLTASHSLSGLFLGDHPRACGAHPQPYRHGSAIPGSSPRMRGSH